MRLLYYHAAPDQPLWDPQPDAFRRQTHAICDAVGIPRVKVSGTRGGGATEFYQATEDAFRTMRRGRWASFPSMNIYLQEAEASRSLLSLEPEALQRVRALAAAAPFFAAHAVALLEIGVPPSLWRQYFAAVLGCEPTPGAAASS